MWGGVQHANAQRDSSRGSDFQHHHLLLPRYRHLSRPEDKGKFHDWVSTLAVFECLFDSRADLNARVFTMSYEWLISHAGSGQELMPGEMKCTVF